MNVEMGYTSDEIIAMRVNNFAIYSPSDENGNDRRTSLDEAHISHQLESMRRRLGVFSLLLNIFFLLLDTSMVAANKKAKGFFCRIKF